MLVSNGLVGAWLGVDGLARTLPLPERVVVGVVAVILATVYGLVVGSVGFAAGAVGRRVTDSR